MEIYNRINEALGVHSSTDYWVNNFADIIVLVGIDAIKNSKSYDSTELTIKYKGEELDGYHINMDASGDGFFDHIINMGMIDFNNDGYKNLPIILPSINLDIYFTPDDILDSEGGILSNANAYYKGNAVIKDGELEIKGKKLKTKFIVKPSFGFTISVPISLYDTSSASEGKKYLSQNIGDIKPIIAHEVTHLVRDYNMVMRYGGRGIISYEDVLNNIVDKSRDALGSMARSGDMMHFIHLLYVTLTFEMGARVPETLYILKNKGIKTKEDFMREIHSNRIWDYVKELTSFSTENFINNFVVPPKIIREVNKIIGDKKNNIGRDEKRLLSLSLMVSLMKGSMDDIIQEHEFSQSMGRIHRLFTNTPLPPPQTFTKKAKSTISDSDVKNPVKFIKKWEKIFHKRGEKLKRKLHNLYSLVVS